MTTILFIVSFCAMGVMLSWKVFEIKVRKIHFVSGMFMKGDGLIDGFIGLVIYKYNLYKKIINLFFFDFLPSYTYEILVKMKDNVSKKYYSAGDGFRGRRILRSNGSVSFFLERLAEEKISSDTTQI